MINREQEINTFLKKIKWSNALRIPLVADASHRNYHRLSRGDTNAILMDASPRTNKSISIFMNVTEILHCFKLSAPKIFHQNIEDGFLLLEDLGDNLYSRLCSVKPLQEKELYSAAIDVLIHLQKQPKPNKLSDYDLATYVDEADLITKWYLPSITKTSTNHTLTSEYHYLVSDACKKLSQKNLCLVMRDYHAENLIWLEKRNGIKRVGILDYQDALFGNPAYDLVSLLEDARRDVSPNLRAEMKARYLASTAIDPDILERDYHILGAQRNLKIIGIFARLSVRDHKQYYLDLMPRVWEHLQRDLSHPDLYELKNWVVKNVPEPTVEILECIKESNYVS